MIEAPMPNQKSTSKPLAGGSVPQRFRNQQATLFDFLDEALVVCPNCANCATVTRAGSADSGSFVPHRLICAHCGLARTEQNAGLNRSWSGAPEDGFFHLPLWLQAPCCGHVLWAHNARHLRFLKAYVGAELRERRHDPEHGWLNKSLASRLPKWMQLAKHRESILRAIGKLEHRLVDAESEKSEFSRAPRSQKSKRAPRKP